MSKQISPFAALTDAEKQIKWLEFQSLRLPYVQSGIDLTEHSERSATPEKEENTEKSPTSQPSDLPQPPPEVPRVMPIYHQSRHSQYDAVIARMKQAELQSRRNQVTL